MNSVTMMATKRPRPLTAAEVAEWVRVSMAQMLTDKQLAAWRAISIVVATGSSTARARQPSPTDGSPPRGRFPNPDPRDSSVDDAEPTRLRESPRLSVKEGVDATRRPRRVHKGIGQFNGQST